MKQSTLTTVIHCFSTEELDISAKCSSGLFTVKLCSIKSALGYEFKTANIGVPFGGGRKKKNSTHRKLSVNLCF